MLTPLNVKSRRTTGAISPIGIMTWEPRECVSDDPDLHKCFLNLPLPELTDTNPVDFAWIHTQQNTGAELTTKAAKYPDRYFNKLIDGRVIVCHALPNENHLTQWKIAITKER